MRVAAADTAKYLQRAEELKKSSCPPISLKDLVCTKGETVPKGSADRGVRVIIPYRLRSRARPNTCPARGTAGKVNRIEHIAVEQLHVCAANSPSSSSQAKQKQAESRKNAWYTIEANELERKWNEVKVSLVNPENSHKNFVASLKNLQTQDMSIFEELRLIRFPALHKVDMNAEMRRSWELLLKFCELRIERTELPWATTQKTVAHQGCPLSICSSLSLWWETDNGRAMSRVEAHEGRDGHRVRCDMRAGDKMRFHFQLHPRALRDLQGEALACGVGVWQQEMQDAQQRGEETLLRAAGELRAMQQRVGAFAWDFPDVQSSALAGKAAQYTRVQLSSLGDILGAMMRVVGRVFPSAPIALDCYFQVCSVIVDRLLGLAAQGANAYLLADHIKSTTLKLVEQARAQVQPAEGNVAPTTPRRAMMRKNSQLTCEIATFTEDFLKCFQDALSTSKLRRATETARTVPFVSASTQTPQSKFEYGSDPVRAHHVAIWNTMLQGANGFDVLSLAATSKAIEEIFAILGSDPEISDPVRTILSRFLMQHGTKRKAERQLLSVVQSAEQYGRTLLLRALRFSPVSSAFSRDALFALTAAHTFCVANRGKLTFEAGARFLLFTLQIQERWYGIEPELLGSDLWAKLENLALRGEDSADARLKLLQHTLCTRLSMAYPKREARASAIDTFLRAVDPTCSGECSLDLFTKELMNTFYHTLSNDTLDCFLDGNQFDVELFASLLTQSESTAPLLDENEFLEISVLAFDSLDKCMDVALHDFFDTHAGGPCVQFTEFLTLCQRIDTQLSFDKLADVFNHSADQCPASLGSNVDDGMDVQTFVRTFRRFIRSFALPPIPQTILEIPQLLHTHPDRDLLVQLRRIAQTSKFPV